MCTFLTSVLVSLSSDFLLLARPRIFVVALVAAGLMALMLAVPDPEVETFRSRSPVELAPHSWKANK